MRKCILMRHEYIEICNPPIHEALRCWFPFSSVMPIVIAYYIISSVMHTFWSVLIYDLLEDRHIDDIIIETFFNSLLYKTNRFQVAVCLFSNRSQMMSKCGKNISDTVSCALCVTFLFLPNFDAICDLLLNRHMATRNLFVKIDLNKVHLPLRQITDLTD